MSDPWTDQTGKRTTTVTVLCILIFVFGGWALISDISEWMNPPAPEEVEEQLDQSAEMMAGFLSNMPDAEEAMETSREFALLMAEHAAPIAMLKAFATLGALIGAWLLWRMRSIGFHVYLISAIVWAFSPMFILGSNLLTWSLAIMYGIVVLVFALLFNANRKYMV